MQMSTTHSSFDQLLHILALKSTVSAPWHNCYLCPSSQQILPTPLPPGPGCRVSHGLYMQGLLSEVLLNLISGDCPGRTKIAFVLQLWFRSEHLTSCFSESDKKSRIQSIYWTCLYELYENMVSLSLSRIIFHVSRYMSFVKLNRNQLIYMCMEMRYKQRLIQCMSSAALARPKIVQLQLCRHQRAKTNKTKGTRDATYRQWW